MMHHKKTRNYSQLNIENYNLLAQNSAQESPHEMGIQCPQYGQLVPNTWSIDARHLIP